VRLARSNGETASVLTSLASKSNYDLPFDPGIRAHCGQLRELNGDVTAIARSLSLEFQTTLLPFRFRLIAKALFLRRIAIRRICANEYRAYISHTHNYALTGNPRGQSVGSRHCAL